MNTPNNDPALNLFRHAVATLAYRAGKALRNPPENFANFNGGHGLRTPGQILAHLGDLIDWATSVVKGKQEWHSSEPQPWDKEVERFYAALKKFDDLLATNGATSPLLNLFQAPIADAFTHVGQIAMLRRMAGSPIKGEDYSGAEITVGRVGADQAAPKYEF